MYQINGETGDLNIKFWAFDGKTQLLENFVKICEEKGFAIIQTKFHESGAGSFMTIKKEYWVPKVNEFISILKQVFS